MQIEQYDARVLYNHKDGALCMITKVALCLQGILEAADRDAIQRGMKMKVSTLCL